MIAGVHDALRSAGQTFPRLPAPPPVADPQPLRAALAAAAATAAAELGRAGGGKLVGRALAKVQECVELLARPAAPSRRARPVRSRRRHPRACSRRCASSPGRTR